SVRSNCVLYSFPTRRSSDLVFGTATGSSGPPQSRVSGNLSLPSVRSPQRGGGTTQVMERGLSDRFTASSSGFSVGRSSSDRNFRSEEHTSELQSRENLVCRL